MTPGLGCLYISDLGVSFKNVMTSVTALYMVIKVLETTKYDRFFVVSLIFKFKNEISMIFEHDFLYFVYFWNYLTLTLPQGKYTSESESKNSVVDHSLG